MLYASKILYILRVKQLNRIFQMHEFELVLENIQLNFAIDARGCLTTPFNILTLF